MLKRVSPGQVIPEWYGIAWHDFMSNQSVCAPLGLNLIFAAVRGLYQWARWGFMPVRHNPRDAYAQGYRDGKASAPEKWGR